MFVAEQYNSASSVCVSPKRAERCCSRRSRLNERITVRVSLGGPDLRDLVRARCSATLRRRKQRRGWWKELRVLLRWRSRRRRSNLYRLR